MIALLLALACSGGADTTAPVEPAAPSEPAAPAKAWGAPRDTQLHRYLVELRFEPETPAPGELFVVNTRVTDPKGEPIEDAKVTVDAKMPQHGHGMETDPVDEAGDCDTDSDCGGSSAPPCKCTHRDGWYRTTGFKFHMPGEWTILVDVNGPLGADNTSFVYDQK